MKIKDKVTTGWREGGMRRWMELENHVSLYGSCDNMCQNHLAAC